MANYIVIANEDSISYGNYGLPVEDFYWACSLCDEAQAQNPKSDCYVVDENDTRLTM